MKRLLFGLLVLLVSTTARAQIVTPSPQSIGSVSSGITVCTSGNCARWDLANTAPSFTSQITGTLTSLTLTAEGTTDGQTWFAVVVTKLGTGVAATTTTSTGQYVVLNTGLVGFRWRCTTYASGGANITLTRGSASSALRSFTTPSFPTFTIGDLLYASAPAVVSGLNDAAVGQVLASGGVGVAPAYTADPAVSTVTANQPGIAVTSTDGMVLANATPATALVPVQQSPRLRFRSNVWNTTVTAANNTSDWTIDSLPTSAATPTGNLNFMHSLNGAGFLTPLQIQPLQVNVTSLRIALAGFLFWNGRENFDSPADSQLRISSASTLTGFVIDTSTDNIAKIRSRADADTATLDVKNYTHGGVATISGTAPTIASGGCTTPAVTWNNGTAAFKLTIGTTCTGVKTITLTLPTAANGWACDVTDNTTPASFRLTAQTTSATAVVISNWAATTGLAIDFVDSEVLIVKCLGG